MQVVSDDTYRGQNPGEEVDNGRVIAAWDTPVRVENIRSALALAGGHPIVAPAAHGDAPILAVHDPALLRWLDGAWDAWSGHGHTRPLFPSSFALGRLGGDSTPPREPQDAIAASGYWCFDSSTGIVAGTTSAMRGSVDIALSAVDLVLAGEPRAYALCRPCGHHAGRDYFGGFCFLNNVAIAARHAQARGRRRVAIVDVDYHHGNGTQAIFDADPSVLVVNLHADPEFEYPYFTGRQDEIGSGEGTGTTVNVPLPAGTDDEHYLRALSAALPQVARFAPDLLLVSLGVDGYHSDPICEFALTTPGFARIGAALGALDLPTTVVQEGGYAVAEIGDNVAAFLCGFEGR